jgi:hypothetical protein
MRDSDRGWRRRPAARGQHSCQPRSGWASTQTGGSFSNRQGTRCAGYSGCWAGRWPRRGASPRLRPPRDSDSDGHRRLGRQVGAALGLAWPTESVCDGSAAPGGAARHLDSCQTPISAYVRVGRPGCTDGGRGEATCTRGEQAGRPTRRGGPTRTPGMPRGRGLTGPPKQVDGASPRHPPSIMMIMDSQEAT